MFCLQKLKILQEGKLSLFNYKCAVVIAVVQCVESNHAIIAVIINLIIWHTQVLPFLSYAENGAEKHKKLISVIAQQLGARGFQRFVGEMR